MIRDWRLWAGLSIVLAVGWLMTIQANRALLLAYRHPQVEVRLVHAKHERKDVAVKRVEIIRYLPGGTTEVTKTEELTDRSQTDTQTSSETVSKPILAPFLARSRLVWVGYSVPERMPAVGANLRLLGPLWIGGWVRPGTIWDYGPSIMVMF